MDSYTTEAARAAGPEPLYAHPHEGRLVLAHDLVRWPFKRHCDASMPNFDRIRVAEILENTGELHTARGVFDCPICGHEVTEDERSLPGDVVANTKPLWWPVALGHLVRAHGLRIDPRLLLERFGVRPDGTRPGLLPLVSTETAEAKD